MNVVYASLYFVARHGESIAGRHLLRSLGEVATVSAVLSYECPDQESIKRFDLPARDRYRFPPPPWRLFLRRFGTLKRWLHNYIRFRGWRQRFMPRRLDPATCDAVVVNGGSALQLCEDLLSQQSCPVLLIVHAPVRRVLDGPGGEGRRQIFLRRTRFISAMAFVSRVVEQDWRDAGLVQDKPTFYLSNCCDEEQVEKVAPLDPAACRERLGLPQDREIVLCLGRIVADKGQDLVVDQMPALLRQRPNLLMIFVGRISGHWGNYDEQWGPDLAKRVEESEYSDRCLFLGEKPNPLEYLRAADLLLLPSRSEALPLVLLEAMALEVPVVASAIDGNAEAVIDGETGLLFASEDSEAMAATTVRLLGDPALRQTLAAGGRERYWQEFSRAAQSRKLAAILEQLPR